ncbi:MAG: hypothetical protein OXC62_11595 [Aestuariivita sp.]|nr:hypothetical protein [Aestuariivita sp.]
MTRGVPMIDPAVHLEGATPEKLAKALLRQLHLVGRFGQPHDAVRVIFASKKYPPTQ